ncbi:MAG: L-lactate dehydrogenase [Ruminococcus sp.]|nr:L-lactate dehydrogenase [Ruminococcus sp.]MDE6797241.1 L-lactate dehydrogenase [Ruminococcus sp.]
MEDSNPMKDNKGSKISVLGAGNVGATIAYTFAVHGTCSDVVLVDINEAKAKGEAMDIRHGISFAHNIDITDGTYDDIAGSDIVVVTLGMGRKPGQSRLDLMQNNVNIIKQVMPNVAKIAPEAIYVVVSNPVDILTYAILQCTDLKPSQVIGSGTILDSARLRSDIAEKACISPKSIHAYMFGEHGDTSFVPWSTTNIGGMNMFDYWTSTGRSLEELDTDTIEKNVRAAGGEVIKRKGATFYAIALSVNKICETIIRNANNILTVSTLTHGRYGIDDVCLSLPCIVNGNGIAGEVNPPLLDEELEKLRKSADTLKQFIAQIDF